MSARRGAMALVALALTGIAGTAGCGSSVPVARPLLPAPPQTVFSSAPATPTSSPTPSELTSTPVITPFPTAVPTPSATPSVAAVAPLIVIDPGHSGKSIRSTDPTSGLRDIDYPNYPEIYEMFDISSCVGKGLEADGYRVTLTKTKALDSVGLAARAKIADDARAALAISVHDDHSQGAGFQATYSQRGTKHDGSYHVMYRGTGSKRTVFADTAVAEASAKAAEAIAQARTKAQGRTVSVRENTYTGRAPLEPGNLAIVQLLAKVPWVYDEAGAKIGGSTTKAMSIATEKDYAKGLVIGVEAAVPLTAGAVSQPSAGVQQLEACLTTAAKPGDGRVTRPTQYRPST